MGRKLLFQKVGLPALIVINSFYLCHALMYIINVESPEERMHAVARFFFFFHGNLNLKGLKPGKM